MTNIEKVKKFLKETDADVLEEIMFNFGLRTNYKIRLENNCLIFSGVSPIIGCNPAKVMKMFLKFVSF